MACNSLTTTLYRFHRVLMRTLWSNSVFKTRIIKLSVNFLLPRLAFCFVSSPLLVHMLFPYSHHICLIPASMSTQHQHLHRLPDEVNGALYMFTKPQRTPTYIHVYIYVYIYIYIYTHIYIYIYICIYIYMYMYVWLYIYVYMYVCVCISDSLSLSLSFRTYMFIYLSIYLCMHLSIYLSMYI